VANRLSFSQDAHAVPDYPSVSGSDDRARLFKKAPACAMDIVWSSGMPPRGCRFIATEDDLYDRI
jgi:hypothetical protein